MESCGGELAALFGALVERLFYVPDPYQCGMEVANHPAMANHAAATMNVTNKRRGENLRGEIALPFFSDSTQLPSHSSSPYTGGPKARISEISRHCVGTCGHACRRTKAPTTSHKARKEAIAFARIICLKKPNAKVNRQKCEAFLSVLNLQLGWWQVLKLMRRS